MRRIATAVIHQAVTDLHNVEAPPRVRLRAEAFIRSKSFTTWCSHMTIDPAAARAKLLGR